MNVNGDVTESRIGSDGDGDFVVPAFDDFPLMEGHILSVMCLKQLGKLVDKGLVFP